MQILNISEAKAKLSAVIEKVTTTGEEVIIGKAGKPVAKIVRYEPVRKNRLLDCFKGEIHMAPDFDEWPDDIAIALGIKDP